MQASSHMTSRAVIVQQLAKDHLVLIEVALNGDGVSVEDETKIQFSHNRLNRISQGPPGSGGLKLTKV